MTAGTAGKDIPRQRRPVRTSRRLVRLVGAAVAAAVAVAGCASATAATTPAPAAPNMTVAMAAWDTGDSAASAKNDITGLQRSESGPALDFSVAGARAAKLSGQKQATYQHVGASFVSHASCVLAGGSIKLAGEELVLPDFSEFAVIGTTWTLTNHVMLTRSAPAGSTSLSGATGTSTVDAVPEATRTALAAELFGRTVGQKRAAPATIAASTLVDSQIFGGWQVYVQQLASAKVRTTRTLLSTSWSTCAGVTPGGDLVFLTMKLQDVLVPARGGAAQVMLPAASPDLQSLGMTKAAIGKKITIARTESYLLQIPATTGAQVQVLGGSDAPTALTAT